MSSAPLQATPATSPAVNTSSQLILANSVDALKEQFIRSPDLAAVELSNKSAEQFDIRDLPAVRTFLEKQTGAPQWFYQPQATHGLVQPFDVLETLNDQIKPSNSREDAFIAGTAELYRMAMAIGGDSDRSLRLTLRLVKGSDNSPEIGHFNLWHIDADPVNLIWTPASTQSLATQSLATNAVDRSAFNLAWLQYWQSEDPSAVKDAGFLKPGAQILQSYASADRILVMLGQDSPFEEGGRQFNVNRGCIHRAPSIGADDLRLLVHVAIPYVPDFLKDRTPNIHLGWTTLSGKRSHA